MAELFLGGSVVDGDVAEPFHLSARDLRTHGVIVGMTGSGKTGLGVVLLEELVRSGVPVIAIDPKGDLGNLGLLFGGLSGDEFAPWVEGGDGESTAKRWREGLAGWGLGAEQVSSLAEGMSLRLFTPGSSAGLPVNVLGAFQRPPAAVMANDDARRGAVAAAVSGLLGLAGRKADPVRDPAHVVLSRVLDDAWAAGRDPGLEELVLALVDPPFEKVGVFPLDRFFPPDDRMDLAMRLNALLASPSFAAWQQGAALDVDEMLDPARHGGRTPVSVFSLAHLDAPSREFLLTLLLGRLLAWTRTQPGTRELRAVLYFDEVAGYIPPHPHNPPTKSPLLTMMKQARAVGFGVMLATQNPVDLDYKALSNAGLWCVGRLQTAQDRKRLLDGIGRRDLDGVLGGLESRTFLVHESGGGDPTILKSRWAMSYLRGPLTLTEVSRLAHASPSGAPTLSAGPAPAPAARAPAVAAPPAPLPVAAPDDGLLSAPPPSPGPRWFLDPRVVFSARLGAVFADFAEPANPAGLVWRPALYAVFALRFDEERLGFTLDQREQRVFFPLDRDLPEVALKPALEPGDLLDAPPDDGRFHSLPHWMDEERELKALAKRVTDEIYRGETRGMWSHAELKLYGRAEESREDFEARCMAAIEQRVEAAVEKLAVRAQRDADRLDDRIKRAERKAEELRGKVSSAKAQEAVNIGETVFSFFGGRSRSLGTAMRRRRQTVEAQERVAAIEADLATLQSESYDLEESLATQVAEVRAAEEALIDGVEEREVRLERMDTRLESFGVLWVPVSRRI